MNVFFIMGCFWLYKYDEFGGEMVRGEEMKNEKLKVKNGGWDFKA